MAIKGGLLLACNTGGIVPRPALPCPLPHHATCPDPACSAGGVLGITTASTLVGPKAQQVLSANTRAYCPLSNTATCFLISPHCFCLGGYDSKTDIMQRKILRHLQLLHAFCNHHLWLHHPPYTNEHYQMHSLQIHASFDQISKDSLIYRAVPFPTSTHNSQSYEGSKPLHASFCWQGLFCATGEAWLACSMKGLQVSNLLGFRTQTLQVILPPLCS